MIRPHRVSSVVLAGTSLLGVLAVGCGANKAAGFGDGGSSSFLGNDGGGNGGSGGGSSGASSGGSGSGQLGGDGGTVGPSSECAPGAAQFIYVISDTNDLYTFDPTLFPSPSAFNLVGPVTCDPSGVNSMAVDRNAVAWVNFNSGAIFKVTTSSPPTCTPTAFMPGQGGFSDDLGMGFSADAPGSSSETLYVSDNSGPGGDCTSTSPGPGCMGRGLGKLDLSSMTLTPLGSYTASAAGYNAELTGTGDAKLYGFFTTSPGSYGPIDKTTGATSSPPPAPISAVNASTGGYAFSFFGGDFYFYTAPTDQTIVTHLQTSTGMTTTSPMLTFTIVGAGVSTCAPVRPPQ